MQDHKQELPTEKKEMGNEKKERTLAEISVTVWLKPENTSFYQKNGFLYIQHGERDERAFLCRQFPFETAWEFISVMDDSQQEIGIIRRVSDFDGEGNVLLTNELNRRYYAPVIRRIHQVKERYGFSYWKVATDEGDVSFTLHDTYRSIIHASDDRVLLLDVDGNRFVIPSVEQLDRKSYKKIELYL